MTNKEMILSLRRIADWYEDHQDCPLPSISEGRLNIYNDVDTEEDILKMKEVFGVHFMTVDDSFFRVEKNFGAITLTATAYRSSVCKKKVVGKKKVIKRVPTQWEEVEEEEDIVEWECPESLVQKKEK